MTPCKEGAQRTGGDSVRTCVVDGRAGLLFGCPSVFDCSCGLLLPM